MNDMNKLGNPDTSPFFPLLSKRILHRHYEEGWAGLIDRIVSSAERAETLYKESDKEVFLKELRTSLELSEFLPNSPLMVNISEEKRKIFACFALDARQPIDQFLTVAREVHDGMGGIGYTLNHMDETVKIQDFIQLFDKDTVNHQEGRPRPASNAVTISIENPGFVALLREAGKTKVTNLNVGISNAFMEEVYQKNPAALEKLRQVATSIHQTGQPAILFTDRVPNVALEENAPIAANVCGESPLAANESGLLGSLNLVKFIKTSSGHLTFDREKFYATVKLGVRFLDGMHDLHYHSSPQLEKNTLSTRKIGVGLMGFAHLLMLLGVRYGSPASVKLAEEIGELLMQAAEEESIRLGNVRGAFLAGKGLDKQGQRRNALLVAIAQTSTLSLLVHTSSGIEPINGYVTKQKMMDEFLHVLDPVLEFYAKKKGIEPEEVMTLLANGKELDEILGTETAALFPKALDITPEEHIEVQAAFQKYIDGGISKTLNCLQSTTVEEIEQWIQLGHQKGLIGFMVYRDHSLTEQPIEVMS